MLVCSPWLALGICNSLVHQTLVIRNLSSSIEQGGVGGGICGLVLANGWRGEDREGGMEEGWEGEG